MHTPFFKGKGYICSMKVLLLHIERLLADNECVIIPDLGGFITYYTPARHIDSENRFLPPYRTIGFNPLLRMNDGLLIQSYMQTYEVSYPVAHQMVESAVNELCEVLYKEGEVQIGRLGRLSVNIDNTIHFKPAEEHVESMSLYGWGAFEMSELKDLRSKKVEMEPMLPQHIDSNRKSNTLVININRAWLNNAVAIAAAVILFFFLSTPVDNTYVEAESYASLGNREWFDQLRSRSLATTLLAAPQTPVPQKEKKTKTTHPTIHEEKIELVSKSVEKTKPSATKTVAEKKPVTSEKKQNAIAAKSEKVHAGKLYHIIVASVGNRADAEKTVKDLAAKGYPGAMIIERDGRVRIALMSGTDKETLNNRMLQLRKNDMFKGAWMLTTRN